MQTCTWAASSCEEQEEQKSVEHLREVPRLEPGRCLCIGRAVRRRVPDHRQDGVAYLQKQTRNVGGAPGHMHTKLRMFHAFPQQTRIRPRARKVAHVARRRVLGICVGIRGAAQELQGLHALQLRMTRRELVCSGSHALPCVIWDDDRTRRPTLHAARPNHRGFEHAADVHKQAHQEPFGGACQASRGGRTPEYVPVQWQRFRC